MLKRIQDLKAIGAFLNDSPGGVQFKPLTFIYGDNCLGKSTLCDIFRSLNENSPEYLTSRISVPNPSNYQQRVQLAFLMPGDTNESPFVFDGIQWNPRLPQGSRLLVFDTDFIHRNLFTGTVIERRNQENLTRFIFGETGTALAERISKLNSHLRSVNADIQEHQRVIFADISDLNSFIALQVEENQEEFQSQQGSLSTHIAQKRELLSDLGRATDRTEPRMIRVPEEFEAFVLTVNDILRRTYERAHLDAAHIVSEHIQHKTASLHSTEQWLSHGLDHLHNEDCPFCGQILLEEAQGLIYAYRDHFDVAFRRFVTEITDALQQFPSQLESFRHSEIKHQVIQNSLAITEYPELTNDPSFAPYIVQHNAVGRDLITSWESWQTHLKNTNQTLSDRIMAKQTALHIATDEWDCSEAISGYADLVEKTNSYNDILTQIHTQISSFKDSLKAKVLREEIAALERQHADLILKQRRQQLSSACTRYSQLLEDKVNTTSEIARFRNELDQEQTQFIDNYFDKIDYLFSRLGSSGFSISKVRSRRGNMPVITITASYSGVPIAPERLSAFFSESDRRALAFSIFWAKADLMTEGEKHSSTLILDDPVTSFDDGRIDRAIRLIESAREPFRQLIVVSHYPRFLKVFFKRAHNETRDIQVARIYKDIDSSKLETASILTFTESEHHKQLRRILGFIDREHREDVSGDTRIYLEEEVNYRYKQQILLNNLESISFGELVLRLRDLDVISDDNYRQLDSFRLSLNPMHHTWVEGSHEDKVALVSDVVQFIYDEL